MALQILSAPTTVVVTKEYALTSLLKLSSRFKAAASAAEIRRMTEQYKTHIVVELQSAFPLRAARPRRRLPGLGTPR